MSRLNMTLALLAGTALLLGAPHASAQEAEELVGNVDISFDVGDYDAGIGDWTIDVVEVTGDLAVGEDFTVELRGEGDVVVWSATQPYTAPTTRVDVTPPVGVAEVTSAGVSQPLTIVGGVQIERPEITWSASGGGGSGQLALSMVLAIIVVAVVFRTPLPSASTQRWTR